MSKSLEEKAVSIQGKKYVLVSDRIIYFNETYREGSITSELLTPVDSQTIIVRAIVRPDTTRTFTGHSQAVIGQGYINKTSALENAETSAVGRALAMMGIGVIDSIASVDEINKTTSSDPFPTKNPARRYVPSVAQTTSQIRNVPQEAQNTPQGQPEGKAATSRSDQASIDAAIADAFPESESVVAKPKKSAVKIVAQCVQCDEGITDAVLRYSQKQHGQPLCFGCQRKFQVAPV